MPQKLAEQLLEKVSAGMTGLWIRSWEHEDAMIEIRELCLANSWEYLTWDAVNGMMYLHQSNSGPVMRQHTITQDQPGSAKEIVVRALEHALREFDTWKPDTDSSEPTPVLFVLDNATEFIADNKHLPQLITHVLLRGRTCHHHMISLTIPSAKVPDILGKSFHELSHPLPTREELQQIAEQVAVEEGEMPEEDELDRVLDAAGGLTRMEAEDAFSVSLVRDGRLVRDTVFEVKAQTIQKSGALRVYEGKETFADIGGLDYLKQFAKQSLAVREENPKFRPKGILLVGVSGGGKSLFAKALACEVDRAMVQCDLGATFGRYIGQSQAQMQEMLDQLDAMAPVIAFFDEFEKMVVGAKGGQSDGGLKADMIGRYLKWQQDHTSDVYVIATCNDISAILTEYPEMIRSGRFDGVFFIDFPGEAAKQAIWKIHMLGYGFIESEDEFDPDMLPNDTEWTGAEIEGCCRLARIQKRSLKEMGKTMIRVGQLAADGIQATRNWAHQKCWAADYEAIFRKDHHEEQLRMLQQSVNGAGTTRRAVKRGGDRPRKR